MEKILVAGATGTTGRHIINLLKNDQYFEPVAMIRKESQRSDFETEGIKTVMGDLTEDISNVTEGIDKVIFAAGSGGKAVDAVDRKGAMGLTDAAKKHKIKKFVMLSSLGADNPQDDGELKEYLQAKRDADEYLANSGITYAIVRPGALNNETPTGKIFLEKSLSSRDGEIPRGDVAQVLVRSLHDDVANREVFEILNGEHIIADALTKVQVENA
ncbi:SDR family oxidoreductase [Dokdonia sinensis]|uniref:SDR family oxidoreductase n=1 Tax=Dokdonia sinensis TaxID=2479847 RepID=A0A3M0G7I4_9FLAO|nr:SDR family oxidoreductase [Dokdonia sinensis]RMB61000.1 SDR family oxidoreductase [Dokdonia sinensis]